MVDFTRMDKQQAARVTTPSGVGSGGRVVDRVVSYIFSHILSRILSYIPSHVPSYIPSRRMLVRVLGCIGNFNQPRIWVDIG